MKSSSFLSLSWRDLGKGIILAFLTAFVTAIYTSFTGAEAHLPTLAEIQTAVTVGVGATVAYLIKNLFTNSNDQFATKE